MPSTPPPCVTAGLPGPLMVKLEPAALPPPVVTWLQPARKASAATVRVVTICFISLSWDRFFLPGHSSPTAVDIVLTGRQGRGKARHGRPHRGGRDGVKALAHDWAGGSTAGSATRTGPKSGREKTR